MMKKAVFLDAKTLGDPSLLEPLFSLPLDWKFFDQTSSDQIQERIRDANIAVTNKVILKKDLQYAPNLQLIAIPATGYDHIDLDLAREKNIIICNAPAYSTMSVAQHTMMLILSLAGSLLPYHNAVMEGRWQKSLLFTFLDHPMIELEGKRLGLIGHGDIGKKVESLATAFGMEVSIAQHRQKEIKNSLPLVELLQTSDFISLHIPLKKETFHLISEEKLKRMKPSAFLINTARGKLIDEKALLRALEEKWIAGAALDVLSQEPPPSDHPLLRKKLNNLIITPHTAWASKKARKRLVSIVRENIRAFLEGSPKNQVSL